MNWPGNVSWSSWNNFRECERRHYYEKILKIPPSNTVETKYSKFGNCVHSAIENIDNFKDVTSAVKHYWTSYNLEKTNLDYNSAIKQVYYALSLNYKFKHKEELIQFNIDNLNFKLFIDGTLEDGSVLDWKTSTFTESKVEDYKEQLLWYTWGTWKHKGYIPPKAILVFTKAQKVFEWSFNEKQLNEFEQKIADVIKLENSKKKFHDFEPNYSKCHWCAFKLACKTDDLLNSEDMHVELVYDHDWCVIKTRMTPFFNEVVEDELSYVMDNAHFVKKAMLQKGVKYDAVVKLYDREKQSRS